VGGRTRPAAVLEQITGVLSAHIRELFVEPARGEVRPKPLRGGGEDGREIVGRLAEALGVEPAELLKLPPRREGRKRASGASAIDVARCWSFQKDLSAASVNVSAPQRLVRD
jgi:hypothetical protein